MREDGSIKIRPIDDMTASGINDATGIREKLSYSTLDVLVDTLRDLEGRAQVGIASLDL